MATQPQFAAARRAQAERQLLRGGPLTGRRGVWKKRPGATKPASDYTQLQYYGPRGSGGGGYRRPVWRKPPPPGAPLHRPSK